MINRSEGARIRQQFRDVRNTHYTKEAREYLAQISIMAILMTFVKSGLPDTDVDRIFDAIWSAKTPNAVSRALRSRTPHGIMGKIKP